MHGGRFSNSISDLLECIRPFHAILSTTLWHGLFSSFRALFGHTSLCSCSPLELIIALFGHTSLCPSSPLELIIAVSVLTMLRVTGRVWGTGDRNGDRDRTYRQGLGNNKANISLRLWVGLAIGLRRLYSHGMYRSFLSTGLMSIHNLFVSRSLCCSLVLSSRLGVVSSLGPSPARGL